MGGGRKRRKNSAWWKGTGLCKRACGPRKGETGEQADAHEEQQDHTAVRDEETGACEDDADEAANEIAASTGAASCFESYYRAQELLESEEEWDAFLESLRHPLPVTFRINRGLHSPELVHQCLSRAAHILEPRERDLPYEHGTKVARPQMLAWCDGVQLGVDRVMLKTGRSQYVKDLREWLMLWGTLPSHTGANTSAGVITRQEVASMVPAALLDVQHWHNVLDLCAAPGSKTLQVLESLYTSWRGQDAGQCIAAHVGPSGAIVANDLSAKRAYALAARAKPVGCPTGSLLVICHHAQIIPTGDAAPAGAALATSQAAADAGMNPQGGSYPPGTGEGMFDRILCDVPCSGDGTLRKDFKVWDKWTPLFGLQIHRLQVWMTQHVV